jgi:RNA-binding protein YlmH
MGNGQQSQQDKLLAARIRDAFDGAAAYREKFVGFLDPHEAVEAALCAKKLRAGAQYEACSYAMFGGHDGAERVFFGVFPPYTEVDFSAFPVVAITISWRFTKLTHRDFLGALLALGIVRGKIGDIVVGDGNCTVFAEKTVATFIVQNLSKVGAAGVTTAVCSDGFCLPMAQFREISDTVASQRLDCVVAVLVGCSRSAAVDLISSGLVSVNFEPCCDNASSVDMDATVSIRGHGRFVIDRMGPQTRKGRLSFLARKYL